MPGKPWPVDRLGLRETNSISNAVTYSVQIGDILTKIPREAGRDEAHPTINAPSLHVGQRINIPGPKSRHEP